MEELTTEEIHDRIFEEGDVVKNTDTNEIWTRKLNYWEKSL